jgi:hypothetical protein
VAGQKAVASVRLPPPWDKEFVVARVSPLGAGQLLVVNEHNAPYELAGSPLAASTGATQTGAKAGPSVLLGRLTGLAAFSRYSLQLTRNLHCSLSTAETDIAREQDSYAPAEHRSDAAAGLGPHASVAHPHRRRVATHPGAHSYSLLLDCIQFTDKPLINRI